MEETSSNGINDRGKRKRENEGGQGRVKQIGPMSNKEERLVCLSVKMMNSSFCISPRLPSLVFLSSTHHLFSSANVFSLVSRSLCVFLALPLFPLLSVPLIGRWIRPWRRQSLCTVKRAGIKTSGKTSYLSFISQIETAKIGSVRRLFEEPQRMMRIFHYSHDAFCQFHFLKKDLKWRPTTASTGSLLTASFLQLCCWNK